MDNETNQIASDAANDTDVYANLDTKSLKNMVTPDAFIVDENLYGLVLARPWRRAGAILLDMLFIAILTKQNVLFLAVVVAATFIRVGKDYETLVRWRRTRKLLRFLSMMVLALVIYQMVSPSYDQYVTPLISEQAQEENHKEDKVKEDEAKEEQTQATSITDWVTGFITIDLGFGFGWAAFYFSVFTAWWQGQTPGKRLFSIRVIQLDGTPLSLWSSFGRYGGYGAGFATGLLGFAQVFWDPNRQAIQDKISSTVVVDAAMARVI